MIKRYEPKQWESATGEPFVKMVEDVHGSFVSIHDHQMEVIRLQERIAELQTDRDGRWYGDV